MGVNIALNLHCAQTVNTSLTAAPLGFFCAVFAVLQEFCRLLGARFDGLSGSTERKSCCNWFLNEGSSADPQRLGGL